jgi:hypothetical protein
MIVVTSAGEANGGGHDAVLAFNAEGALVGAFSDDPRIVDPPGLSLDFSGKLISLNSADRVLALDRSAHVVRDSGPMAELDPGGAAFGRNGRLHVTTRRRRTILGLSASLDGNGEPLLQEGIVPSPRGFGFRATRQRLSRLGHRPARRGRQHHRGVRWRRAGASAVLGHGSRIEPSGHDPGSEWPHRRRQRVPVPRPPDALVTIREYDPATGEFVRIFASDRSVNFRQPRGLRLRPEGHLYCVGEAHVIAFDFSTGDFLGPVVELPRLNGQALVLLDERGRPGSRARASARHSSDWQPTSTQANNRSDEQTVVTQVSSLIPQNH